MAKVAYSFKSQRIEKIKLFSQETENCQNLGYESLIIIRLKYIEISRLAIWKIKW